MLSAFADLGYIVQNNDVPAMVLQFQLDHDVVSSSSDVGAGNYGPKTKAALKAAHDMYNSLRTDELDAIEKARQELLDERTAWEVRYKKASNSVSALSDIQMGQKSSNILALQSFLCHFIPNGQNHRRSQSIKRHRIACIFFDMN